jgi:hypothetical protein
MLGNRAILEEEGALALKQAETGTPVADCTDVLPLRAGSVSASPRLLPGPDYPFSQNFPIALSCKRQLSS